VKIVDALLKHVTSYHSEHNPLTFYKSDREKYFEIEVVKNKKHERYIITLNQLRIDDKDKMTDGEGEYWFDYKIN
jgi:hypothetical protein